MSAVATLLAGSNRRAGAGVGAACGTFGELLQGRLPEHDGDFLITLPIARWSVATFHSEPESPELLVSPPHKTKALRLTRMITDWAGAPPGGRLSIDSTLPEGKGMASSSADLVATARAVANGLGVELPCRRLETMLARIEPTDGVLYPGVVAYHHRSVRLRASLGDLPPVTIVAVDEGGQVDTVAFNHRPKPFTAAHQREYSALLDAILSALPVGDLPAVGRIATRSAALNQLLNPKRWLDEILGICTAFDGLGVVTAHSGTTLGILLDDADPSYPDKLAGMAGACRALAGDVAVYRSATFGAAPDDPRWRTV
ncbi:kinase [Actinoplanes sp. OR16]|uniref:GHMP family kinase ATP-binding protein n=1 Tax=Actinoplanes sp. OR16 TaxID=946334 RepID=UPI000F702C99|nr:kinase [Actinoplanes sp. OR16]BBH67847.1 kinase [Actinoplanes sp. OR16]